MGRMGHDPPSGKRIRRDPPPRRRILWDVPSGRRIGSDPSLRRRMLQDPPSGMMMSTNGEWMMMGGAPPSDVDPSCHVRHMEKE